MFWRLTPQEYVALDKRHKLEQERRDFRAALVCSVLANVNRDPKRKPKPYTPKDFMPEYGGGSLSKRQTPKEMLAVFEMICAMQGGKDLRKKGVSE